MLFHKLAWDGIGAVLEGMGCVDVPGASPQSQGHSWMQLRRHASQHTRTQRQEQVESPDGEVGRDP